MIKKEILEFENLDTLSRKREITIFVDTDFVAEKIEEIKSGEIYLYDIPKRVIRIAANLVLELGFEELAGLEWIIRYDLSFKKEDNEFIILIDNKGIIQEYIIK